MWKCVSIMEICSDYTCHRRELWRRYSLVIVQTEEHPHDLSLYPLKQLLNPVAVYKRIDPAYQRDRERKGDARISRMGWGSHGKVDVSISQCIFRGCCLSRIRIPDRRRWLTWEACNTVRSFILPNPASIAALKPIRWNHTFISTQYIGYVNQVFDIHVIDEAMHEMWNVTCETLTCSTEPDSFIQSRM